MATDQPMELLREREDHAGLEHLTEARTSIRADRVVCLHYALTVDGRVVERQCISPPFAYLHGAGNVVPGLERGLAGHCTGDRLLVVVPPEFGYGPVKPEFIKRVARREFPAGVQLEPGMRFRSLVGDRMVLPAWIQDVDSEGATVSFNHPLAGKVLRFAVAVLQVRTATAEELAHGHPHGPGGVHHGRYAASETMGRGLLPPLQ